MPNRSKTIRVFCSLLLVVTLSIGVFADTIRLKDGSIIKGKIVSFGSGKFLIEVGQGSHRRQLSFDASEIESIKFDSPDGPPQLANAATRPAAYEEPQSTNGSERTTVVVPGNQDGNRQAQQSGSGSGAKMKPIEWRIKVLADNTANGWTNTGWVVKKGQRIRISSDGKVSLGKGQSTTAAGLPSLNDEQKLLKNVATGALIAVIGDDNNDFIYVGAEREFTATRDGALFLGINEGYLDDNSGAFNVKVEILPDVGS
jgi:PA-IL-like protein